MYLFNYPAVHCVLSTQDYRCILNFSRIYLTNKLARLLALGNITNPCKESNNKVPLSHNFRSYPPVLLIITI